jgi:hypothetical protein
MTDAYTSTNFPPIQHWPMTLPLTIAAADCYELRRELIEAEAAAVSEQEAEIIIDRRLEADDAVWSAVIRDERDILTKIDVLAGLVQSMTAAEMLPFIAELQRRVAEFAQRVRQ